MDNTRKNTHKTNITVIMFEDLFAAMGTSVRLQRMLDPLMKAGQVTVISSSDNIPTTLVDTKKVKTVNLGTWLLRYKTLPIIPKLTIIVIWNLLLTFHLLRIKSDVIFCSHEWLGYFAIYLVSFIKKYKIIIEIHSIISQDMEHRGHHPVLVNLERKLEQFFCTHSNYVIALSQNTYDFYRNFTDKIELTHVFVDSDIFVPANKPQESEQSKVIGLIGPFVAGEKRGKYCLDFLATHIDSMDSRVTVSVIGRCDEPVTHKRIVYTGFLDSLSDYVAALQKLDAVLVPEGISTTGPLNKILEPMSCAIPVFATPEAIVGLYWIESGRNIFVFSESDLTEQLNKGIFNSKLMQSAGEQARMLVEQHYSKKANETKLFQIFKDIGFSINTVADSPVPDVVEE